MKHEHTREDKEETRETENKTRGSEAPQQTRVHKEGNMREEKSEGME